MSNSNQETIETIEVQTLHAKLVGINLNEGYVKNICGTYENIIEYCKKNKFKVGHFYDYSELNSIPDYQLGDGFFEYIGSTTND